MHIKRNTALNNKELIKLGLSATVVLVNKNDHRSGGAVKGGCTYLCIMQIIRI